MHYLPQILFNGQQQQDLNEFGKLWTCLCNELHYDYNHWVILLCSIKIVHPLSCYDKYTAKYLVVCQHYIHLSPETMQKLPLGTSLQGMEKCIPNLPFPSVQAAKYPKQLSEQKILENTFIAEIRLVTFNSEKQQIMYPNPLPKEIWNQGVPCWAD